MNQLDDITVTDRSRRSVDHQLLPARIFDDPPVVDIFEGITGDLLLVRAAPPIVIPDWIVDFVRMEPAGDWLGDRASQSHLTPVSHF